MVSKNIMYIFSPAILIEHSSSPYGLENIFKEKKAKKILNYIETILGYETESYDYFWNVDQSLLDENGYLKKGIDFDPIVLEMDCPVIYVYAHQNILQINFRDSWSDFLNDISSREIIIDLTKELLSLLNGTKAIAVPTSQGEDYPSSTLKAAKVVLSLDSIYYISDALNMLADEHISQFEKVDNTLDHYFIIQ